MTVKLMGGSTHIYRSFPSLQKPGNSILMLLAYSSNLADLSTFDLVASSTTSKSGQGQKMDRVFTRIWLGMPNIPKARNRSP